jgi:hypothetical protein
MEPWKAIDTENALYVGILEFQSNDEEWYNFEIYQTENHLVFGSHCNVGFIESGNMEIDDCFSLDENLQELLADLETYYNDGKEYVSRIVCSERM